MLERVRREAGAGARGRHRVYLGIAPGVGKTYTGLAILAGARQEGWVKRPVILVPNSIVWKWFNDIRDKGMKYGDRAGSRKNGSIVVYDTSNSEVLRFNFFNAWPSKIGTDQLSADSHDPVKETIVLACERLERVK